MRYIKSNIGDEEELLGIKTIWATNYMNLEYLLLGTISPIRLS
jgi:hypothetical protein